MTKVENSKKRDKSTTENLKYEKELWGNGITNIVGVDECGRGPFAGPVVACAVIMPKGLRIERLTDSKKIAKREHKYFADLVKSQAIEYSIGISSVEEIDSLNIRQASMLAMKRAVLGLKETPGFILVDGIESLDLNTPQTSIVKGDFNAHTISAAAIVAKVYRDELMNELDSVYGNVYGWKDNAGYQTKKHIEACYKFGITPQHRKSWKTMNLFV